MFGKNPHLEKMSALAERNVLGAGNFLYHAIDAYGDIDVQRIYSDIPYKSPTGKEFTSLSLAELQREANILSEWYLDRGISTKDRVVLYLAAGPYHLVHYVALNSIGAIPTFINSKMEVKEAILFSNGVQPKMLIASPLHYQKIQDAHLDYGEVEIIPLDHIESNGTPSTDFTPYEHHNDDPVLITHSSGTTGIPKGILMAHQQFFHAIRCHLRWPHPFLLTPAPEQRHRFLSMLPTAHNSAISHQIRNILSGIDVIILGNTSDGKSILTALEHYRPSVVMSFPENYLKILRSKPEEYDLGSISHWINTGDAAHTAHIKNIVNLGQHHTEAGMVAGSIFYDGIGSSEMSNSFSMITHTITTHYPLRCVGKPKPTIEAVILDEKGEVLPANKIGKLGIKTPSIIPTYWNDANLFIKSWRKGYWLTGDLAYYDENGNFYHVDRVSDSFCTPMGEMYTVLAEEVILNACEEVFDCTVCSYRNQNSKTAAQAILVLKGESPPNEDQLVAKANNALRQANLPCIERLIIKKYEEVPVGITGKVLKRMIRDESQANNFRNNCIDRYREVLSNPLIDESALDKLHGCRFLTDCRNGAITVQRLKGFIAQHYHYSKNFINYLCALIASLDDKEHIGFLLKNLAEEAGLLPNHTEPHFKIYQKMIVDLGINLQEYTELPATHQLRQTMMACCRDSDPLIGLAALLLGAEAIVPYLYSQILAAFQNHDIPVNNLAFFTIHIECDDGHAETLFKILQHYLHLFPQKRTLAVNTGTRLLLSRKQFFENIYKNY